jgi:hypothetical protein
MLGDVSGTWAANCASLSGMGGYEGTNLRESTESPIIADSNARISFMRDVAEVSK